MSDRFSRDELLAHVSWLDRNHEHLDAGTCQWCRAIAELPTEEQDRMVAEVRRAQARGRRLD